MIIDDILPSWEVTYPSCDDDFTFPKVGYVIVPRAGVGFHKSPLFFSRRGGGTTDNSRLVIPPIATLHYLDSPAFSNAQPLNSEK